MTTEAKQISPEQLESRLKRLLRPKKIDVTQASLLFNAALSASEPRTVKKEFRHLPWDVYGNFYDLGIACRDSRQMDDALRGGTRRDLEYVAAAFNAVVRENYKRWFGHYPA